MNVLELRDLLSAYCDRHPRECVEKTVVVQTGNGGIPHSYLSPVKDAYPGFDWTTGFFIICPEDNLVVEKHIENVSDFASSRFDSLRKSHEKLGFKYCPGKSSKGAWIQGFIEGVWQHITGEGKKEV